MTIKKTWLVTLIFALALFLLWMFNGTGVIKNDPKRNIFIPEKLTFPLEIKAAYNEDNIFFRYRWPSKQPHIYHDLLKYEKGEWLRHGGSSVGPEPEGIYEDRLTMFVDDGSVHNFDKYGGYITIGDKMRYFTKEATRDEVESHPYLGQKKHKHDVRKYLPETREDPDDWASVVSEKKLKALRKSGYFLDLWHWRAHRSNPIGKSDDQYVAEFRYGDAGKGVYYTNWDKKSHQPKFMFDKSKVGFNAIKWPDIKSRKLGFEDIYYLAENQIVPFDPKHAWKEGDTIPRRILRTGDGSHSDISVVGKARWKDGFWDVTLVRKMDTKHPLDDKKFIDTGIYSIAVAVHRNATGSRWHYVSMPVSLGLERNASLQAVKFNGDDPSWKQDWHKLTLFYPGQVSWPLLNSHMHQGSNSIKAGVPAKHHHSEKQLAIYGVEMEFNKEIKAQWFYTLICGFLLIAGLGFSLIRLMHRGES